MPRCGATSRIRPGAAVSPGPVSRWSGSRTTPSTRCCRPAARCSTAPGECTGFITAGEWGTLETPVFLTSTLQLGRVYDAACELMLERYPDVAEDFIIPVVAECDDSFLNDARRMQVTRDDVARAWEAADASVGAAHATGRGRGRLGHRHELPRLQGRDRHRVARDTRTATPSACC